MKWDLTIEIIIKEKGRVLSSQVWEYDNIIFSYNNWFITYLPQFINDLGQKSSVEIKNKLRNIWRL